MSTGEEWAVHAYNTETQELLEVDSENEYFPKERDFFAIPIDISCQDGFVALQRYEADQSGVYLAVKLYDLEAHKLMTIDRREPGPGGFNSPSRGYSCPYISDGRVANCDIGMEAAGLSDSKIMLYTIAENSLEEIPNPRDLAFPVISGDFISAMAYSSGAGEEISVYDIQSKNWIVTITPDQLPFAHGAIMGFSELQMYDGVLCWQDTGNQVYAYDVNKSAFLHLPIDMSNSEYIGYVLNFNSDMLAWVVGQYEGGDGKFQFVVLKAE